VQLERDVIEQARNGALTPKAGPSGLFATCDTGSAVHRNRRWATTTFDPDRRCSMTRRRIARRSPGSAAHRDRLGRAGLLAHALLTQGPQLSIGSVEIGLIGRAMFLPRRHESRTCLRE